MISTAFAQIEAGQSVIIKIMGVPAEEKAKIDETYPVAKNGMVNMPFVGEIRAAGLESHVLAKSIQNAYRDGGIFNNAVIQVLANQNDIAPVEQQVHLGGRVNAPGAKPFRNGLTVYQAIQAAGGPDEFGAMNRVILIRMGKQQIIDLRTIEGKSVLADVHDTIVVPQKNWRNM
ncbi:polysaccharide biosynthesis/export family protein [Akkermansiaceae bacterium]|nr:polysaccharide biosynthesis/export family protein [Akkermansiaceae bacterium]